MAVKCHGPRVGISKDTSPCIAVARILEEPKPALCAEPSCALALHVSSPFVAAAAALDVVVFPLDQCGDNWGGDRAIWKLEPRVCRFVCLLCKILAVHCKLSKCIEGF